MSKKDKKIVIKGEILNILNAISILVTYIIIGLILYFDNNFFGSVTNSLIISFFLIGLLCMTVIGRRFIIDYNVKGFGNVFVGIILIIIFILLRTFIDTNNYKEILVFIYQLVLFVFLLTSVFVLCKGIFEIIYSLVVRTKGKSLGLTISNVIILIAQIIQLIVLGLLFYQIVF